MTEQSLIERVARALAKYGEDREDDEDCDDLYWEFYAPPAVAIIKAMREPTPAIADIIGHSNINYCGDELWRKAIDAALADDPAKAEREGREG